MFTKQFSGLISSDPVKSVHQGRFGINTKEQTGHVAMVKTLKIASVI